MQEGLPPIPPELDAPSFLEAAALAAAPAADDGGFSRIAPHLLEVRAPAQYLGGERGSVRRDWDAAKFRFALGFPDLYVLGAGYHGMQILYHLLNAPEAQAPEGVLRGDENYLCERFFCPAPDMMELMEREDARLWTLESKRPLADFDAVGFSFNYEGSYSNLPRMLRLAGIPVWARERREEHPLVIGGGECMLNPEPLAEMLDAVAVGEGEELALELARCLAEMRGAPREAKLAALSQLEGIYIPGFYEARYDESGAFLRLEPQAKLPAGARTPETITRRMLANFSAWRPPLLPVVPYVDTAGGWANIEVMRGCPQRCRFCHAGFTYLPARARDAARAAGAATALERHTGAEQVSLLALSLLDHPQALELLRLARSGLDPQRVSMGMPSLRMDAVSREAADLMRRPRESSLTFAPEAGTQRLRDAINKRVLAEEIEETFVHCAEAGWHKFKLYFIIGFPGETEEDVAAIAELTAALKRTVKRHGKRPPRINVSVNTLVPKAHTPLQWAPLAARKEIQARHRLLRAEFRRMGKSVRLSYSSYEEALVETLLARGSRKMSQVIAAAEQRGLVFQGDAEHFDFAGWMECCAECGVDAEREAHGERGYETPLPWEHLGSRVRKRFLWSEWQQFQRGIPTPPCTVSCLHCGVGCGEAELS